MRSADQILDLLDMLEHAAADELEGQDLDLKSWNSRSHNDALKTMVEWAVCMANGGGGTVVFGVADKVVSRQKAILGVPTEVDIYELARHVYDSTDPKITPVFEELRVAEGTGRLLVMQIQGGLPPYTDSRGLGKIRIGKDCKPLTGTMRRRIGISTGYSDFTATEVPGQLEDHISLLPSRLSPKRFDESRPPTI